MKTVLVTGCNGGIGLALCSKLSKYYDVIGIDNFKADNNFLKSFYDFNLERLVSDQDYRKIVKKELSKTNINFLINNAAIQHLSSDSLDENIDNLIDSININAIAPYALIEILKEDLTISKGKVINIGSIHSSQTKIGFTPYSVSKSALQALTKSLSIEYGQYFSVIGINPAAVETQMLVDGFQDSAKLKELKAFHPTNTICSLDEISDFILSLLKNNIKFLNGSIINLDGGISHLLNDPENLI